MGGHERDANKAVVAHFPQRGDVTVYGRGGAAHRLLDLGPRARAGAVGVA